MRVAVFICEDAPKWQDWTDRIWSGLLEEPGDTFTHFRCFDGEFPDASIARERFDVIVVSGSHYSAYDDLPWIRQLERLLPQYNAAGVRIVGCCFGHQVMAQAFGGSVGKNPSGRFVLGVEDVHVDLAAAAACGLNLDTNTELGRRLGGGPGAEACTGPEGPGSSGRRDAASRTCSGSDGQAAGGDSVPGAAATTAAAVATGPSWVRESGPVLGPGGGGGRQRCLRMLESHGDQVLQLPPGATLLAASSTAPHEMWALGRTCLAFQFHPELTPDLVYDKIWSALSSNGRLSAEEAATAEAHLREEPAGVDSDVFLRALGAYMRAPPASAPAPVPAAPGPVVAAAAGAATAAAGAAEAASSGGVQLAAGIRRAAQGQVAAAAESVMGHVRQAAAAGMAAGTSNAELLTDLNREAAAAYGKATIVVQDTAARVSSAVATQQEPLKAALASLGALEAQLDRLAAVVGTLELESELMEQQAAAATAAAGGRAQAQA